jgi:SAM-dependent MidA family methyltransferase
VESDTPASDLPPLTAHSPPPRTMTPMPPPDPFADDAITERSPLVQELRARIEREGPITFRDFMQAALYHPRYGYYMTADVAMSRGGDYVTSPEVHPVFGTLVAAQLREMWHVMSCPTRFGVVEMGAGRGLLARDILRAANRDPEFAAALAYSIIEVSPALLRSQRRTFEDAGLADERVTWRDALPAAITGCVLSNELIDAFAVHRVVRHGDRLEEVYVTWRDGRFVDEIGPLSDASLRRYFDDLGLLPGDGCYAEVNLDAIGWLESAGASLARGYVLTFDYGYEAAKLYAPWRRDGTLLCFYRQDASSDPYQRIGRQDMTASVDFTTLQRAGERAGLRTGAMTDQSSFLIKLGIGEGVAAIANERPEEMEEYFARRRVVMDLTDPARLGRIKVLLQGKDVPDTPLRGFAGE